MGTSKLFNTQLTIKDEKNSPEKVDSFTAACTCKFFRCDTKCGVTDVSDVGRTEVGIRVRFQPNRT
jgi:hypothetical protein